MRKGIFLSAILFLSLFSCQEDGELVPEFNSGSLNFNDVVIEVTTSTEQGDSILTANTSRNPLGKLNDETYGLSVSDFYSQLSLTSTSLNLTDEVFDSVILYLHYDEFFGFDYSQEVQVYEISEDMDADEEYYSNFSLNTVPEMLGSATLNYNSADTISDSAVLRVKIDNALAERIKNEGNFENNAAWLEFFKGIKITTDEGSVPTGDRDGVIAFFFMQSPLTKMSMYYQDGTETKTIDFEVNSNSARFSHFENTYADSLNNRLGKTDETYNHIFALSGSRTKITFDNIAEIASQGPIAINKAELIIPYEDQPTTEYVPADRCIVITQNESGNWVLPTDFFTGGSDFFGGQVDLANKRYVFNLASTLNEIINKGEFDKALYLTISGGAVSANRFRVNSGVHPGRKIYLILSYTKSG